MKNIKKLVSALLIAGFLICGTNFNVFAAELEEKETREIDDEYKTCYGQEIPMVIEEQEDSYQIYSIGRGIEWEVDKIEETRYASANVFIRQESPNIEDKDELTIPKGTTITRVGISDNGWDIIKYDGQLYFMWYEYIVDEKPTVEIKTVKKRSTAVTTAYTPSNVPAVATATSGDAAPASSANGTYAGTFQLTAYEWTGNPCANGNYPTCGYTVASNYFALGTRIYIEGYGTYVVEDRGGMSSNVIDIYMGDYNTCIQFGRRSANVYILN